MLSWLALAGAGFALGLRHAADADHVVAVSIIATRERRRGAAALLGLLWAIGHTATLFLCGAVLTFANVSMPEQLGYAAEALVGLMLVGLGVWALRGVWHERARAQHRYSPMQGVHAHALASRRRAHPHRHGDYVHTHMHSHAAHLSAGNADAAVRAHGHAEEATPVARLERWFGAWPLYRCLQPLAIGAVHGLGGTAAFPLLVAAAAGDVLAVFAYLFAFGVGTAAGMIGLTLLMVAPLVWASRRKPGLTRAVRMACALASVALGVTLIAQHAAPLAWAGLAQH